MIQTQRKLQSSDAEIDVHPGTIILRGINLGKSLPPVMRRLKSCYRNPMLQARITCSVEIRGIVLRQNVFRPKWNHWSLPYFIRGRILHSVEVFRVSCPSMTCHVHIVKRKTLRTSEVAFSTIVDLSLVRGNACCGNARLLVQVTVCISKMTFLCDCFFVVYSAQLRYVEDKRASVGNACCGNVQIIPR